MAPDPVGCCNSERNLVPLPRKTSTLPQLSTEQKKIVQIGTEVAEYVIPLHVSEQGKPKSRTAVKMAELVKEIETQNEVIFNHMCSELSLTTQNARTVFSEVTREIFNDSVNFGRIVTLYAFAGKMAQHFAENGHGEMTRRIILWVSHQMEICSDWMQRNGGWDGFEKHFTGPPSRWTTTTKGFLLAAVGLGVAGCLLINMK